MMISVRPAHHPSIYSNVAKALMLGFSWSLWKEWIKRGIIVGAASSETDSI